MGAFISVPDQASPPPPPKVVLVPPLFQRDVRGLSRFCQSSYDYLGNRKQLTRLLRDHLSPELGGMLLLSPPDDPRISVRAKMRRAGGSMVLRWQPSSAASLCTFIEMAASLDSPGDVSLRGSYLHQGSGLGAFVVAPLGRDLSGEAAQVGVRYSSTTATAGAIFVPRRGDLSKLWLAGRFHGLTLGLQLSPALPVRHALTALIHPTLLASAPSSASTVSAGSSNGGGDGGVNSNEPVPTTNTASSTSSGNSCCGGGSNLAELRSWFRSHACMLLAFSPPPRPGAVGAPFTASVELKAGGELTFSFFQHVAATRQVVNPFEEDEVVGITNYLDIGLQLTTAIGATDAGGGVGDIPKLIRPNRSAAATVGGISDNGRIRTAAASAAIAGGFKACPEPASSSLHEDVDSSTTTARPATIDLALSWQINKNWLLKARVGNQSAAAAVGARVWHAVSAYLTASVRVDYAHIAQPRYGIELCVENFGPLLYERGADDVVAGRALLQRHEASKQDLDNFAGRGVLIRRNAQSVGSGSGGGRGGNDHEEGERRKMAELM
ncbi:hypothetical protein VaNZ11_006488 [Volvox africanus]|uniref:Bacterial surface antigen (D15) domain-containing protein n=1 Tax=Volvox africanus TaxID=51714 RepID=A0ABQ5S0U8_9CHLO|nr:hypothetical protein VaNZ11_006488 [Volvox africanus]